MDDDWDLIVSSFQAQYGLRLSKELKHMSWREFSYMLSGLGPDTPLGRIVSIRAETDPDTLKLFTKEQKRIRNDYQKKIAKNKSNKEVNDVLDSLKDAFIRLAGDNHEKT